MSDATILRRSENVNELVAALAKARPHFGKIVKSHTAKYQTKRGVMTYNFASLDDILEATVKPLAENGLVVFSDVLSIDDNGRINVTAEIHHNSGQWKSVSAYATALDPNDSRSIGAATTYGRRYAQQLLLNIFAEEDVDGEEQDSPREERQRKPEPDEPIPTFLEMSDALSGSAHIGQLNSRWSNVKKYVAKHYENDKEMLRRLDDVRAARETDLSRGDE